MTAGVLLTGGRSRRMGADKATLVVGGERLVDRAERLLAAVCDPVVEVGPGRSGLPAVVEDPPGAGPLAALVAGAAALRGGDATGPVLLLAVDLPLLTEDLVRLIAERPGDHTVVPLADDGVQPCCARYSTALIDEAGALLHPSWTGERSLRRALAGSATAIEYLPESTWRTVAPPHALDDVDTPDDLARLGFAPPL